MCGKGFHQKGKCFFFLVNNIFAQVKVSLISLNLLLYVAISFTMTKYKITPQFINSQRLSSYNLVIGFNWICRTGNLRNHEYTHTNERPYKCEMCGKGFNQMSNLVCHKIKTHAHAGTMQYTCGMCDKEFPRRSSLRSHEESKHGIKYRNPSITPSSGSEQTPPPKRYDFFFRYISNYLYNFMLFNKQQKREDRSVAKEKVQGQEEAAGWRSQGWDHDPSGSE